MTRGWHFNIILQFNKRDSINHITRYRISRVFGRFIRIQTFLRTAHVYICIFVFWCFFFFFLHFSVQLHYTRVPRNWDANSTNEKRNKNNFNFFLSLFHKNYTVLLFRMNLFHLVLSSNTRRLTWTRVHNFHHTI